MIEKPVPLEIPPGIFSNGTEQERAGRWMDGNLVRFVNGHPRAVGNWDLKPISPGYPGGIPRTAFAWYNENGGAVRVVIGTSVALYIAVDSSGTSNITNITPSAGVTFAGDWPFSFTNIDDTLIASKAAAPSALWSWNVGTGGVAAPVANFSTTYGPTALGVAYTPESFLAVLVGSREVAWASQGTTTTWAPTSTNSAGALTIPSNGGVRKIGVVGRQTFIWTTTDLWELEYVGGDLVYGIRGVGQNCGIRGPNCVSVVDNGRAFWMGENKFFQYDGFVRELPCDIADYVFGDINNDFTVSQRAWSHVNEPFNEIWFHYTSAASLTPDRVAIYNYVSGVWSKGAIDRAAGTDSRLWLSNFTGQTKITQPWMLDAGGIMYVHEVAATSAPGAYLESGPIAIEEGARVMRVQKLIPDGARNGDVIRLYHRVDPSITPQALESQTVVTITSTTPPPVDVRFSARYIRYEQTLSEPLSRIGIPQLGVIPGGTR